MMNAQRPPSMATMSAMTAIMSTRLPLMGMPVSASTVLQRTTLAVRMNPPANDR
jgi:hypothetical protein